MRLGNLDIQEKMILAPMADITDAPFRRIAKENGAGLTLTQMVSVKGVIENQFDTLRNLAFDKSEKPIGVQILANDPSIIDEAVSEIVKFKPDLIDLNSGCPVEKVTRHKLGASLLEKPDLLSKIIRAMKDAAGIIPVSVKLRLGIDQNNISILRNAKLAEDNGASLIFVHARSKNDPYSSDANWEWLRKVKENVNIPVVGNGSVFTPQDAVRMKKETGVDSVLIARGALGNPFIFSRFNELVNSGNESGHPSAEIVRDTALWHVELIRSEYGKSTVVIRIKKHLFWYFRYFNGIKNFINEVMPVKSVEKLEETVIDHSNKIIEGFYPEENLGKIEQEFTKRIMYWIREIEPSPFEYYY